MDTTGQILLAVAIATMVGALVGFYFLSKHGPRGAVLGVAAAIYLLGRSIPKGNIRELYLVAGVLTMTGFIGGILGIIDLIRSRPRDRQADQIVEGEVVEESGDSKMNRDRYTRPTMAVARPVASWPYVAHPFASQ